MLNEISAYFKKKERRIKKHLVAQKGMRIHPFMYVLVDA